MLLATVKLGNIMSTPLISFMCCIVSYEYIIHENNRGRLLQEAYL